ncbi:hypothetical protein CCR75_005009 [Bremia lactucae]|uniref:Uncharacterized protein n=1 Tax=Bremia lactucae TaxID=4779 RepID=A0A976FMP5_BRELC|nr:hypothetical protein CCR75_005009 [Bremia lactucae]
MIDPFKDKFAYFKDNIQTAEDKEEFDASQYYYHRDEFSSSKGPMSSSSGLSSSGGPPINLSSFHSLSGELNMGAMDLDTSDAATAQAHGLYSGYTSGLISSGSNSFLGGSGIGRIQASGSAIPPTQDLQRLSFQLSTEKKAPDISEFPVLGSR